MRIAELPLLPPLDADGRLEFEATAPWWAKEVATPIMRGRLLFDSVAWIDVDRLDADEDACRRSLML